MALKRSTLFLSAITLAALAGLAVAAFREEPVPVDLHRVARGPMQITVNADGKTRVRNRYEVFAPIVGTARRSPVEVGDAVIAGETVVAIVEPIAPGLLDSRSRRQAEAAVEEATAARKVAETRLHQADEELAFAQSQLDRTQSLVKRGVATLTQLEEETRRKRIAEALRDAAASELAMASGALNRARASLIEPTDPGSQALTECCVELRAPISGEVLEIDTVSEHPVIPGVRLLTVGQSDDLEIVADLLSNDAVRLAPGAEAMVERWGGPEPLKARLDAVEPSARTRVSALGIEEQRVDATFELLSPPEARPGLGDGFSVFLRVVEWSGEDRLQVPLSAIFRTGEGWAVYLGKEGVAHKAEVTLGRRNSSVAEVLDGLAEGDLVITHPSDAINDGTRIAERSGM